MFYFCFQLSELLVATYGEEFFLHNSAKCRRTSCDLDPLVGSRTLTIQLAGNCTQGTLTLHASFGKKNVIEIK